MKAQGLVVWHPKDRRYFPLAAMLTFVLATAVTLLYVVFSVMAVDGDSMEPALHDRERILVTKGYADPARGDIIAFAAVDESDSVVKVLKRVIAVEGDTVEVVGDVAYVNGSMSTVAPRARIGERAGRIGPLIVPRGHVYVLGDNRPYSLDSRFFGAVPLDSVIGKGIYVILPLARIRDIDE
ncbi:MAG: signal peptidase I [Actinobacteria bacterium]|nr:signal peptidase I [Actinomycetota bacterium]